MNVLFMTIGSRRTPSTRFRVKQYLPLFKQANIPFRHVPIPHATVKRVSLVQHLRWADVIFLQKKLFSLIELKLIMYFRKPLIFDMDDVVFYEHPLYANTKKGKRKIQESKKRFNAILKSANTIIVGNETLAKDIEQFGKKTEILPTPVNTYLFHPNEKTDGENLIVGWIGTSRNLYYFDLIKSPLQKIAVDFPSFRLHLICDKPKEILGVPIVNIKWSKQNEISELQKCTIGIMPLTDDIYSRGKCGFKLLQYMSLGMSTVSSPIGMNSKIVSHGKDGFLANSELEWEEMLRKLLQSQSLRHSIGKAARQKVLQHYSLKKAFPILLDIIKKSYEANF